MCLICGRVPDSGAPTRFESLGWPLRGNAASAVGLIGLLLAEFDASLTRQALCNQQMVTVITSPDAGHRLTAHELELIV